MKAKELLKKYNACNKAIEWAGDKTVQEAWDVCECGDWMLWIYAKLYPENIRQLTLVKGHCAKTIEHLMKDERSIKSVQAAIDFGNGLIQLDELLNRASYASYAAYAAAYAAADAAAYVDADADAKKQNQKQTADICRKYLKLEF